ncbi:hypothetical protein E4T48_03672 [Aureobasidium sp. EXF-10727]|nr:hypothetical protein E4T48_03672 [Aureobasidium sp. EXF-10727]
MSSSPEKSREDLLQDNERLKQQLQKSRGLNVELTNDYNALVDEFNDLNDRHAAKLAKLKEKRNGIQQLMEENDLLQIEIDGLETDQKQLDAKVKEKTRSIRKMVKERDELQEKLAKRAHKADGSLVTLNFEVKQNIATSTRLDKQLGDETFRRAMDQIYERFRECFLVVRRSQEFDIKTALSNSFWERFLSKRVPSWRDNTLDDRLYVCIALVSQAFTQFVNNQFVFGLPNKNPIQAAWWAWMTLADEPQTSQSQQDVKKWLALTSTVLTNNHRDLMVQAREDSLDFLLDSMKENLEIVTTLEFTDAIRRRLSDAISPHLTTLRMLHYQEWNYNLKMVTASREGAPVRFSRAHMEGMFWEETGFVQASLFPQLCRLEEDDEDDEDENDNYTVICKARVAVVADWEEEMQDAGEDPGDSDGLDGEDEANDSIKNEEAEGEKKKNNNNVIADSFDKAENEMDQSA